MDDHEQETVRHGPAVEIANTEITGEQSESARWSDLCLCRVPLPHNRCSPLPGELTALRASDGKVIWHQTLAEVPGYALSEDGLWRQHSWTMRKQPNAGQTRILETTLPRVTYFGFLLNDTEAETFAEGEL